MNRLLIVASLLLCSTAFAQKAKKGAPDQAAMMEAMQKFATPGPEHARLKAMTGTWTGAIKMWMDPAAPPMESTGTEEAKMILGDRYLQQDSKGSFMGQPYSGIGLTGYDNAKKKFVGTWIDNMGTGIMTTEGTCDAAGKVCTYETSMTDPMTGKVQKGKMVIRIESDTKHTMEMYGKGPNGKEFKMMEIVYTRKGVAAR